MCERGLAHRHLKSDLCKHPHTHFCKFSHTYLHKNRPICTHTKCVYFINVGQGFFSKIEIALKKSIHISGISFNLRLWAKIAFQIEG